MSKELVDYLDEKFNNVDKQFGQMDRKFGQVDRKFDQMDRRFDQMDRRFGQVDKRINQMNKKIDNKFGEVLSGQDGIVKQLSDLEQESQMSTELYKKHDKEIQGHEKRILSLETK